MDRQHLVNLIIKKLRKCEDVSLLDLIYKILLQA